MTTIFSRRSFRHFLAAGLLLSGCEATSEAFHFGGYRYSTDDFEQWKLPRSLREISGLAISPDGRLFAHADERAIVHQIDYHGGKLLKSFSLSRQPGGKPGDAVKGDFEGIALVGERVYLVTSDGTLYSSRIGVDGSAVPFEVHPTGLGAVCEIEGLAYHPNLHVLLLACKVVREAKNRKHVLIFQWSIDNRAVIEDATIAISLAAVVSRLATSDFNPSGVEVSPRNGNLLLVAARQRALLEASLGGEVVNVFTLPMESYHQQSEGIALFADGTLILADEGGKKRGRLGVYRATD